MSNAPSITLTSSDVRAPSSLTPWLVCFSAALFFFYEFIQMMMFNAISTDLMRDFSINGTQLGLLSATYLYADVAFLFPAGIILDRVSTRKLILGAMSLCVASTFLFALSHSFLMAGIFHFMGGIGNAFCLLSCVVLASRWFPPRRQALVIGLVVTFAMLGGVVAQTPMTLLSEHFGWRHALQLDAMLGVIIMVIIWFYVRDYPPQLANTRDEEKTQLQALGFWESIRLAIVNKQNWFCGIYTSLLNLPIMTLGAVYGGIYITQVHHFTMAQATLITSMIFFGTIIGSPTAGFISDRLGLRRLPMLIGGIISLVVMLAMIYIPEPSFTALATLMFLLGFFTSAQVISYPMITESNPRMLTGTSMGLASVLIMGGGAISQPIFGWLLDLSWDGQMVNHVPLYAPHSYLTALIMMPICFVIGLIAILRAKETYCQTFKETPSNPR